MWLFYFLYIAIISTSRLIIYGITEMPFNSARAQLVAQESKTFLRSTCWPEHLQLSGWCWKSYQEVWIVGNFVNVLANFT